MAGNRYVIAIFTTAKLKSVNTITADFQEFFIDCLCIEKFVWMKLVLKNTECFYNERLYVACRVSPCLDSSWHYHPQFELLYVSKSKGIRFVGDSVSPFSEGDLVLVGSNLPHLWRNDPSYYKTESEKSVQTVVIKFMKDFLGIGTFELPQFSSINQMLENSKYGLSFDKSVSESFHADLLKIVSLSPAEQSISLLDLLYKLSLEKHRSRLSSSDMQQSVSEPPDRLDGVIKHISDNYTEDIRLKDVADLACMTTNSFCRFFKKMTNKSFTQFLNEIRVRNASRLLLEDQHTISTICYKVGYKSMTNFYRQFNLIMGMTPKKYRQNISS